MKRRYWLLAIVGLCLGLGIPLFLGGGELGSMLGRFSWTWLALLLLLVFLGWNLNAGRLRLLAGGVRIHLGQGRALAFTMATCQVPPVYKRV